MELILPQKSGIQGQVYENQPLAPLTTWKIGGPARFLAVPYDVDDVCRLLHLAQTQGWPLFFLGRGSNVLIDDAGLPGLTLHLARGLQELAPHGDTLLAGAGVSLPRLAQTAANLGFAGFEFLAGIPGTVGGGVRLNAGAEGQNLAELLTRVWVITPRLQVLEVPVRDLAMGYRASLLLHFPHWLVVEAEFALRRPAPTAEIKETMRHMLTARRQRNPANPKSCGSVFKNPAGAPAAGRLIEEAGFKGRRRGDAAVSLKHANFILNRGQATAEEVKDLIALIQEGVLTRAGVALEREVVFLPDDLE